MYHILGIKKKKYNSDAIIALYNYMSLSFSLEPRIDYSYIKTDGLNFSFNQNTGHINDKCKNFNRSIEKVIRQFDMNPNEEFKKSLTNQFVNFYMYLLNCCGDRNKMIIKSIRNAVEHGNYSVNEDNNIFLYDLPKQNDLTTIKFKCIATPKALFNITNAVNNESLNEEFTQEDFFNELKSFIDDNILNKLITNFQNLSIRTFEKNLDELSITDIMHYSPTQDAINDEAEKTR
jgi:hypothetical protein